MDWKILSSDVIPAVAARLKYYVDVERKEVGFDLSLNTRDTNEKYRLYEQTGNHTLRQNQKIKNHFLEKQMEAALRHYIAKSEADKKDKMETKQEKRRQVQRKIKKNMSALAMPDRFPNNCDYPSSINQKSCDLEGLSSNPPDISHSEFKRLIASAADLIVATTPGCHLPHLHQHEEDGVKADLGQYFPSPRVKIPTSKESIILNKESHTQCIQNVDYGFSKLHPIHSCFSKVTAKSKNIDYEIIVHIGAISPTDANPSLFMRLIGDNGKSKTLFLQNILHSGTASSIGQVVSSYVKAKDVGELKQIIVGVNEKNQDCRCYCISITILKEKTKYVFSCKKWLSRHIVMVCDTEGDSLDSQIQAEGKETENNQTQAKTCRPSDNRSSTRDKNNPSLITSKIDDLNSCESTRKVEKCEAEDIVVYEISSTETEVSKKGKAKKIEVSQINNTKSPGSPKRYKNKASKRTMLKRHASSEEKPQDISYYKEETSVIRNQSGKDQRESDRVPKVDNKIVYTITKDDRLDEPVLKNNSTNKITKERKNSYEDLQEQKTIQTDGLPELKHRSASSPASFVFFSYEKQELSILDKVNIYAGRNTGSSMNPNSRDENTDPTQGVKERAECSFVVNNRDNDGGASKLNLLQQILLESEGNLKDGSPGANSPPSIDNLENPEKTESQYEKSDQSNEVQSVHAQIGGCDGPYYLLDTAAIQHSGCPCSCEDCWSYESDSTLNEEYLFSDSSLALSPSEDEECAVFSKSTNLDKDTKEFPQKMLQVGTARQDMRITNHYHIHKERKVDSCNENSDIFQRSLTTIHSSDVSSLKNFCHSYFFLPSIKDEKGKTLLHHAAAQENPHIIQVLLDTTVGMLNIDQQDIFNKTALHYAVENGNTKTIKTILDRGAKVEIPDESLKTVLDIALRKIQAN